MKSGTNRASTRLLLLLFLPLPIPCPAQEETLDGPTLAARLRGSYPSEDWQVEGTLEIKPRGSVPQVVPIEVVVLTQQDSWRISYATKPVEGRVPEKLVIVHHPKRPNDYFFGPAPLLQSPPELPVLSREDIYVPFAGSDFWLVDLGLEFFHWPQQKIIEREMRKGRACKVLESRPVPGPKSAYSRVLSWIDNESGALILAEAYDQNDKLCKEFEVRSFKKVEGQWELQSIQIRNPQTRSRTRLEFQVE